MSDGSHRPPDGGNRLRVGAIDAWVNTNLGVPSNPIMDVGYLFPELRARWERGTTLSQLVDEMDEAGVEKAVLCSGYGDPEEHRWVCQAMEAYPDRLAGSHIVDPGEASMPCGRSSIWCARTGSR